MPKLKNKQNQKTNKKQINKNQTNKMPKHKNKTKSQK